MLSTTLHSAAPHGPGFFIYKPAVQTAGDFQMRLGRNTGHTFWHFLVTIGKSRGGRARRSVRAVVVNQPAFVGQRRRALSDAPCRAANHSTDYYQALV